MNFVETVVIRSVTLSDPAGMGDACALKRFNGLFIYLYSFARNIAG
jgi:hypothetical protein